MRISLSALFRLMCVSTLVAAVAILLFFGSTYYLSIDHLKVNPPTRPQNRVEEQFFFRPMSVTAGDRTGMASVIEHLKRVPYVQADSGQPATFRTRGKTLEVFSAKPDRFPNLVITFSRTAVRSILANGKSVQTADIQPQPISSFSRFLTEANHRRYLRRIPIEESAVTDDIRRVITSVEDRRFFPGPKHFAHHGCDPLTVAYRAALGEGGGSGFTAQTLKNNVFARSQDEFWNRYLGFLPPSLQRKAIDCQMALGAETLYSKNEIFLAYLNLLPVGAANGIEIVGIEAAANEFYGKHANELTITEIAEIGGMIHGPSLYLRFVRNGNTCGDLTRDKCRNLLDRRNFVLKRLRDEHPDTYSEEQIQRAKQEPLRLSLSSESRPETDDEAISRGFIRFTAKKYAEARPPAAEESQTEIITSLDLSMQRAAYRIVSNQVEKLQPRVEELCAEKGEGCRTVIDNKAAPVRVDAALVAMDAQNGEILALVTGINSEFDFASEAQRDGGSLFKPFFNLAALAWGTWNGAPVTAATIIDPETDRLSQRCGKANLGRRAPLRESLARSYNFAACALSESAGIPTDFVGGLTKTNPKKQLASAIGETAEGTLIDLVSAYRIYANNGILVPYTPFRAASRDGFPLTLNQKQPEQAADPAAAFITTDLMRSVLETGGTLSGFRRAAGLPSEKYDLAAKTGTAQASTLWAIVVTPRLIVGAVVMVPENNLELPMEQGFTGGQIAAPIAAEFLKFVRDSHPAYLQGRFNPPPNVVRRTIDPQRGCITNGVGRPEYFIIGREAPLCE